MTSPGQEPQRAPAGIDPGWSRVMGPEVLQRLRFSGPRAFDLVFDDRIPASVWLHPDGEGVAVDLWCGDAADLDDADRRLLIHLLLGLNARSITTPWQWVGLDSRDLVLFHARTGIDGLGEQGLLAWLGSMVQEARQVRSVVGLLLP